MTRLALFGGTFDPPHLGHLIVASDVADLGGFDRTILMVSNDPWQKRGSRVITPAEQRLRMVEAAVDGHDRLVAGDLEIRRGGVTYTVDTVEALLADGGVECTLVLGADAVAGLGGWHRADDLRRLVDVAAVRRPGHAAVDTVPGWDVRSFDVPAIEISSTEVRQRCADGRPIDFLVPDAVRSVIGELGLYGVRR